MLWKTTWPCLQNMQSWQVPWMRTILLKLRSDQLGLFTAPSSKQVCDPYILDILDGRTEWSSHTYIYNRREGLQQRRASRGMRHRQRQGGVAIATTPALLTHPTHRNWTRLGMLRKGTIKIASTKTIPKLSSPVLMRLRKVILFFVYFVEGDFYNLGKQLRPDRSLDL